MKKTQQKKTVFLDIFQLRKQKSGLIAKRYCREIEASIPSLQQASRRDQILQKLHRWRKQSKTSKLQETYDENIRIFISLKKQKSEYRLKRKPTAKLSQLKLPPLSERNLNKSSSRLLLEPLCSNRGVERSSMDIDGLE